MPLCWTRVGIIVTTGGTRMDFLPLGDVELHYTSLEFPDYGVGGQHYGTLDGWLRGEDV